MCNDCNRTFFGQDCFAEHKRNRSQAKTDVVCMKVAKCLECNRTITNGLAEHRCGYSKCSNCKEYCDASKHECYITNVACKGGKCTGCDEKKTCFACKTYTEQYMFFDFECEQETGVHNVNLVVVHNFEGHEWVFQTIEDFCGFMFSGECEGYTFLAHNAKGYDAQFILKWCVDNGVKHCCIYAGTKIMSLEIRHFKMCIIDSINCVASSLAAFLKTFGLNELKKGYFPHYFNNKCNQNYVGPMPSKKHYGYDSMSAKNRK